MQAVKGRLRFEDASKDEVALVKGVLSAMFGDGHVNALFSGSKVVVARDHRSEVFLVSHPLYQMFEEIKKVGFEPYSLGLFLGVINVKRGKPRFRPSLEVCEVLFKASRRCAVMVSEKAAQLALYGRPVFWSSVMKVFKPISEVLPVVVLSPEEDPIALGRIERVRGETLIRVIMDKGWYLRRGG